MDNPDISTDEQLEKTDTSEMSNDETSFEEPTNDFPTMSRHFDCNELEDIKEDIEETEEALEEPR